jgi:hypothetical protein
MLDAVMPLMDSESARLELATVTELTLAAEVFADALMTVLTDRLPITEILGPVTDGKTPGLDTTVAELAPLEGGTSETPELTSTLLRLTAAEDKTTGPAIEDETTGVTIEDAIGPTLDTGMTRPDDEAIPLGTGPAIELMRDDVGGTTTDDEVTTATLKEAGREVLSNVLARNEPTGIDPDGTKDTGPELAGAEV